MGRQFVDDMDDEPSADALVEAYMESQGGDADEVTPDEGESDESPDSVDDYLDRTDNERMEYDRLVEDLYPMPSTDLDEAHPGHIHRDTDAVQVWMRQQRHER